jgi:hypothetical protein
MDNGNDKRTELLDIHPAAAIFPMMSDEEIAELGESIRQHGLREKIQAIRNKEKNKLEILDGRNRLEAIRRVLKLADKEIIERYVTVKVFGATSTTTPEEYVVMANIERRNLTQPQRRELAGRLAMMLSEAQKLLPKEAKTDTTGQAAKMAGVSRRTAASAKKVTAGKPAPAKTPANVPPRPVNVIQQLEAARKTLRLKSHVAKWTTPQLREAYARATDIVDALQSHDKERTLPGDKIVV